MNITEPFVLKGDVLLIPCTEIREDMRDRIAFDEGDYTLSRRHGRTLAQVIDGETAALLALFREPRTIVDAVLENSKAFGKDPRARLDELLPHFGEFVHKRVLVPAGSEEEKEIRPRFDAGATIEGWTIIRCASLIEDSEIYQVRNGDEVAALKIARMTTRGLQSLFDNEATILRHLHGASIAPRLIGTGTYEERPYLLIEWIPGVDASVAAAQRRHDRPALLELCAAIAEAYAELHARGVVHGDVHLRNVIAGDAVKLVDFGYARLLDDDLPSIRGGVFAFFEPEYFAAQREGRSVRASAAGEQYALGALLYRMIAGDDYLEFRYEKDEMALQIENEPPLPFAKRGVPPWPEVERILLRALEKSPAQRHASIAEMASLLTAARESAVRDALAQPVSDAAKALLEETLIAFSRGGATYASGYTLPPLANINFGAAGAAVGILRIAETRGDAALLALADVWRSRAAKLIGNEDAYYHGDELTRRQLGEVTPYHTESGIHAAAAMIAAARGDTGAQRRALAAFLRSSQHPCAELDVTLGRSGSLLACALLLPISEELPEAAPLRALGTQTMREIWEQLDARPPIAASTKRTFLGVAHGWAGYIYAALRWCESSGDALPPRLVERLHELAAMRHAKGRGIYWRKLVDSEPNEAAIPAWCNGSAGYVFLFVLAHKMLGDEQWLELATRTAWNCWDEPRGVTTLCCGTAGRAYALLNLYKHTGATEWLSRARQLANHAAEHAPLDSPRTPALWRGALGTAVLIADLESPENARMPFFE
ncbi:MAG TPA: lanthionine synthetase LanC family protein [Thermoanaerobaculia bacterium]|nr:lanthionine synthetase LanC family protein [Thermoanaerobaculia bacterium]